MESVDETRRPAPVTAAGSEAALVEQALKGNAGAFEELIERHRSAVVAQSFGLVGDYHTAEDLAQEAFVKAFESLADLKELDRFGGWLSVIVRHTCLDWLRAQKSDVSLEVLRESGFEVKETVSDQASKAVEVAEDDQRVLKALMELREDYREIIALKHLDHLSYKEIADRLGMSVSAVGEKLSRVRGLLKLKLEKKPIPRADMAEGEAAESE